MTANQIAALIFAVLFVGGVGALVVCAIRADEREKRERLARLPPLITTQGQIPPPPTAQPSGFIITHRVISDTEYNTLKAQWLAAQRKDATPGAHE